MNNDRELLELAAKAIGRGIRFRAITNMPGALELPSLKNDDDSFTRWNPLEQDGDALRLSTKLRLDIMFFNGFEEVMCSGPNETDENVIEPYSDDIDAAVRRAIVRAAAEIGRVMK